MIRSGFLGSCSTSNQPSSPSNGAIAKFRRANVIGPHFADPLKGWGDASARQGRWKEAMEKYSEGLKYAPTWQALRNARDAAARRIG
jgi:tetratricopeptide (TPR) repeat protein